MSDLTQMIGKTFISIKGTIRDNYLEFTDTEGNEYTFVGVSNGPDPWIEDIVGDLNDLLGTPMVIARVDSNDSDSFHSWTFYNFGTVNGYVTIRWCSEDARYYGARVIYMINKDEE